DSGEYFLTANSKQLKTLVASLSSIPGAFSNQQDLSRIMKPTHTNEPRLNFLQERFEADV
ncbi:MAG: hypothetical protein WAK20_01055, partial [Candidatus Acidiferrum sp.]